MCDVQYRATLGTELHTAEMPRAVYYPGVFEQNRKGCWATHTGDRAGELAPW